MFQRFFPFTIVLVLAMHSAMGQTGTVTGILSDDQKNARPGVRLHLAGTAFFSVTTADGSFRMDSIPFGTYALEKADSAFDYVPVTVVVEHALENIGSITLRRKAATVDGESMPVYSLSDEESKEVSQGVSSMLSASRNAFESAVAFTFGAARYRLRGYNDEEFITLMNGAPMTDLGTDRTLYNTWSGLNDVTRNRESSTGLAALPYTFGGTGGAYNIDSRASAQRRQLQVSYALSNRTYDNRFMLTYGSGITRGGWSYALSYSRRWSQEGYVDGTFYDGHSWFASLEKIINDRHSLALTAFGTPTRTGRASPAVAEMYDLAGTHYYNPNWGYQAGKKRNASVSDNNRPVYILTHDWKINEKSSLLTAASYMTGNSRLSGLDWYNATDPRPDYYRNLPSYVLDNTGDTSLYNQVTALFRNDESVRQLKWDQFYLLNTQGSDTSLYVVSDRVIHTQLATLNTAYQTSLNDVTTFSAGATAQQQVSHYYKELTDLLGGDFFVNLNQFADDLVAGDNQYDLNDPDRQIRVGDTYQYDYDLHLTRIGAWGQVVMKNPKTDWFAALQLQHTAFYRDGHMRNGVFADASYGPSKTESFFTYRFKAGATYKINGRNYVFVNGLTGSRAPLFDNIFIAPMANNKTILNPQAVSAVSVEAGYMLKTPLLRARAVGYITENKNESDVRRFYNDDFRTFVNYALSGINTHYVGSEFSVEASLGHGVSASGVAVINQSFYSSNQQATVTQDNLDSVLASNVTVYSRNLRVGGAPENAFTLGLNYRSPRFWYVYVDACYFANQFVRFNPARRTAAAVDQLEADDPLRAEILGQEKLDGVFTLNVSGGWSWKLNNRWKNLRHNTFLVFNIGINNVLNNTDWILTQYEQLRYDFVGQNVNKFDDKRLYAYGTNFFASVTLRFN